MLYQCLKKELSAKAIHFASVRPGIVDTAMQVKIRDPSNVFDNREYFVQQKKQGALMSPDYVAKFFEWLLFAVDDDTFSREEWDIRDQEHHVHWLD